MTLLSLAAVTGSWNVFVPYGGMHAAAVCVCAAAIAGMAWAGRALRERHEMAFRRALAIFALGYWVAYNVWWNRAGIDLADGLPLHICDLNGLIAPLALLTLNRWLRAALYFWTFALTVQAFVQPTLTQGPAFAVFWWFWAAHTIITACAVYDLAVLRFRPGWDDLKRAYVTSAIYLAAIIPLNRLLGTNYGFIGNPPPEVPIPPFIDTLGPWPLRAVLVVLIAAAGFVLVKLPWRTAKMPAA